MSDPEREEWVGSAGGTLIKCSSRMRCRVLQASFIQVVLSICVCHMLSLELRTVL